MFLKILIFLIIMQSYLANPVCNHAFDSAFYKLCVLSEMHKYYVFHLSHKALSQTALISADSAL